ncbi:MAG: hypothetical protein M1823_003431 [Watsoniomyces obsoletus]|nr:MAG: hypothetical protein M1823_003431 [Watsoniomyces obsoletus]
MDPNQVNGPWSDAEVKAMLVVVAEVEEETRAQWRKENPGKDDMTRKAPAGKTPGGFPSGEEEEEDPQEGDPPSPVGTAAAASTPAIGIASPFLTMTHAAYGNQQALMALPRGGLSTVQVARMQQENGQRELDRVAQLLTPIPPKGEGRRGRLDQMRHLMGGGWAEEEERKPPRWDA